MLHLDLCTCHNYPSRRHLPNRGEKRVPCRTGRIKLRHGTPELPNSRILRLGWLYFLFLPAKIRPSPGWPGHLGKCACACKTPATQLKYIHTYRYPRIHFLFIYLSADHQNLQQGERATCCVTPHRRKVGLLLLLLLLLGATRCLFHLFLISLLPASGALGTLGCLAVWQAWVDNFRGQTRRMPRHPRHLSIHPTMSHLPSRLVLPVISLAS